MLGLQTKNTSFGVSAADMSVAAFQAQFFALLALGIWTLLLLSFPAQPARAAELPQILSETDAQTYQQIFALQSQSQMGGQMGGMARLSQNLSDKRLMGHVLAQRYLHPAGYIASFKELEAWLKLYADHPQAAQIYALAVRKRGAGDTLPRRPVSVRKRSGPPQETVREYRSTIPRSKSGLQQAAVIKLHLKGLLKKNRPDEALDYLAREQTGRYLDKAEIDIAHQAIAASYFQTGRDQDALQLAAEVAQRNARVAPLAHWTAGLAAWRLGRIAVAAQHFSTMADMDSPYLGQAAKTAANYWAARANLAVRRPQKVNYYLKAAAKYPQTMYGLLAHRQLGIELPFDWKLPPLTEINLAAFAHQESLKRLLALHEAGQTALAESELQALHDRLGPENDRTLLSLALTLKLPLSQISIAKTQNAQSKEWLAGLYPIPHWQPHGGFTLDPALLFAIARQESSFVAGAVGGGGARGLMQLMPATASFISRDKSLRGAGRNRLFDPEYNLTLGQRYIQHLQSTGSGDLFSLIAGYNAGPAAVENWRRRAKTTDPLLFLESLPRADTRDYVQRVLADFWIYQHRMGVSGHSLDAVAAGGWPELPPLQRTGPARPM